MVDLLTTRTMNITKLSLDGLMMRQNAISANIANVMTPNYQRKEVAFESQLSEIIEKENLKDYIKEQNSIKYTPRTIDAITAIERPNVMSEATAAYRGLTTQEANFLQSDVYNKYNPQVMDDIFTEGSSEGNNVELEKEMMDLTKAGTKYVILSNLEKRAFAGLNEILKSQ